MVIATSDPGAAALPSQIMAERQESWLQPKEARMVPREKAAHAYGDVVRQRVDPALVEWAGAGVFNARVFPLAPGELHRIVVGYDVDLVRIGEALAVPARPAGEGAGHRRRQRREARARRGHQRAGRRGARGGGAAAAPLRGPAGAHDQGAPRRRPGAGARGRRSAARRLLRRAGRAAAARRRGRARRRHGGVPRRHLAQLEPGSLQRLAEAAPRRAREEPRLAPAGSTSCSSASTRTGTANGFVDNTPENVDALLAFADTLALEGATDLGAALAEAARPAWLVATAAPARHDVFLLSDGAATWGEGNLHAIGRRLAGGIAGPLFAYQTGLAGTDIAALAHLARETGGARVLGHRRGGGRARGHRAPRAAVAARRARSSPARPTSCSPAARRRCSRARRCSSSAAARSRRARSSS